MVPIFSQLSCKFLHIIGAEIFSILPRELSAVGSQDLRDLLILTESPTAVAAAATQIGADLCNKKAARMPRRVASSSTCAQFAIFLLRFSKVSRKMTLQSQTIILSGSLFNAFLHSLLDFGLHFHIVTVARGSIGAAITADHNIHGRHLRQRGEENDKVEENAHDLVFASFIESNQKMRLEAKKSICLERYFMGISSHLPVP
jgi:hypothetical protein